MRCGAGGGEGKWGRKKKKLNSLCSSWAPVGKKSGGFGLCTAVFFFCSCPQWRSCWSRMRKVSADSDLVLQLCVAFFFYWFSSLITMHIIRWAASFIFRWLLQLWRSQRSRWRPSSRTTGAARWSWTLKNSRERNHLGCFAFKAPRPPPHTTPRP